MATVSIGKVWDGITGLSFCTIFVYRFRQPPAKARCDPPMDSLILAFYTPIHSIKIFLSTPQFSKNRVKQKNVEKKYILDFYFIILTPWR